MSLKNIATSRNLGTTLTLAFVAMSVAALVVSGVVGIISLFQTQKEAVAGRQHIVAHQAADAVAGFIQKKFIVMEAAVRLTGSQGERENALQALLGMEPAFRQLLLLTPENKELFRASRMSRTESGRLDEQLGADPFLLVSDGQRHIGSVYVDQVTSEPLVISSVPVTTLLGDRLGALLAEVNLKFIWQLVDRLRVGQTGHAYVVDRQGRLIAFGETGRVLRGETLAHLSDVAEFIDQPGKKENIDVHAFIGITGKKVVGTYVPLGDPDWAVMTELPVVEAYRPVIRNGLTSIAVLLCMSALAGWLGIFLARRLVTPIVDLTRAADRVTEGQLDVRAPMEGPTEVVRLSSAFNQMTRQLGGMLDEEAERTRTLEREIAKRREMESSLRFARYIIEKADIAIFVLDENGAFLEVNEQVSRYLGYSREELGKMSVFDVDTLFTPDAWAGHMADLRNHGVMTIETLNRHKNGTVFPVQVIDNVMTFEDREFHVAFVQDITERKQAEAALRENEQLLANILESMNEGVIVLDREFRYQIFNPAIAEIINTPKQEVLGKRPWDVFDFIRGSIVEENMRNTMRGKTQGTMEVQLSLPHKHDAWFRESYTPLKDADGQIVGVIEVVSDITRQKQGEEEVRRLRNYLSNIIDSMPSILVAVDHEGRVTQWNRQAEDATGLTSEDARARPLDKVFPRLAGEMARIGTAIRECRVIGAPKIPLKVEQEIHYEDITIFPLVANGVEGAVIRVDDVTQQVRLEEMMIQSEKMLSVGGLAAGMAHEINNPLAGILQNASVLENRLLGDLPANHKAAETAGTTLTAIKAYLALRKLPDLIGNIRESGTRAAAIVRNMLSFARKSEKVVSNHHLTTLLDQTLDLLRTDYDMKKHYDFKQIRIQREYDQAASPVPCEAGKLQQVFMNILKNGAEAMAEVTDASASPALILRVQDDGAWVRVEIEDNGPGMDEGTRRRIFEPFFTTKPLGKGSGLGLSVSYFIVTEDHGGEMRVVPAVGGGTCFVIRLPKAIKAGT